MTSSVWDAPLGAGNIGCSLLPHMRPWFMLLSSALRPWTGFLSYREGQQNHPWVGFTVKRLFVLPDTASWGRKGALRERGMRSRRNVSPEERAQERQFGGCQIADIAETKENKEQPCLMRRMITFLWPLMDLAARFHFFIIMESICSFDLGLE